MPPRRCSGSGKWGGRRLLDDVFAALQELWGTTDPTAWHGRVLLGFALLLSDGTVSGSQLVRALKTKRLSPQRLLKHAIALQQASGGPGFAGGRYVAEALAAGSGVAWAYKPLRKGPIPGLRPLQQGPEVSLST